MSSSTADSFILSLDDRGDAAIAEYVLCGLGFVLVVASFIVQFLQTAAYGKFDKDDTSSNNIDEKSGERGEKADGDGRCCSSPSCRVPQRLAHVLSDCPPGICLFVAVFVAARMDAWGIASSRHPVAAAAALSTTHFSAASITMACFWLAHYVHRGILHPLCIMRYSAPDVDISIPLGGFFPNCIFSSVVALHISLAEYGDSYAKEDPRFIVGCVLFVVGFVVNKHSDWVLRSLRDTNSDTESSNTQHHQKGDDAQPTETQPLTPNNSAGSSSSPKKKYFLPTAGIFRFCYCANYFGEFVEWVGFAVMSSSLPGVLWALFGLSTFLPRSLATKKWYLEKFPGDADEDKAALIPFVI